MIDLQQKHHLCTRNLRNANNVDPEEVCRIIVFSGTEEQCLIEFTSRCSFSFSNHKEHSYLWFDILNNEELTRKTHFYESEEIEKYQPPLALRKRTHGKDTGNHK
jgi:hypothetical protein